MNKENIVFKDINEIRKLYKSSKTRISKFKDRVDALEKKIEIKGSRNRNHQKRWLDHYKNLFLKAGLEEMEAIKERQKLKKIKSFYHSKDWLFLRYEALKKLPKKCACCAKTEGEMHVDHIKPRSKYPELELDFNNLQILCRDCNLGKSNLDETDWRNK
jgi:5-methylcytosine-specific restriction endonuclease McrA